MAQKIRSFKHNREVAYNADGTLKSEGLVVAQSVGGSGTIATTGNSDLLFTAAFAGVIDSIDFAGASALAANDSNYITFSVTNLGQGGAGSNALLAATDPNTTKATGGTALTANARRALTLHGTSGNLVVAKGDVIRLRAAATGTLAGAINNPCYTVRIRRTA
jgi:hypothetical protein